MNYIILLKPNISFSSILTLNVIVQNIEKMDKEHFKIILIHSNKNIENSFYFNKNKYHKIINYYGVKEVFSLLIKLNTSKSEKTLIDISKSFYGKIINFLIRKRNKKNYFLGEVNYSENEELLNSLKQSFNYGKRFIKKPIEYVDKKEKKETLDYINWNMETSNLKEIKKIRYIYIILDDNNFNRYFNKLEVLANLCHNKTNLKTIFTFTNTNHEENKNIKEQFPEKMKKNIIGIEFWNCENSFIINLIENSRFVITDNESCNFYCDKIDKDCLLINQNNKNEIEENLNDFENKTSFLLKNCI